MTFAILPAAGIGDGLLMQISACHLQRMGVKTVTFSKQLAPMANWFPSFQIATHPPTLQELSQFDGVVLQHDNSILAQTLRSESFQLHTLFASYSLSKHGPLRPGFDAVFDRTKCMAENIALSMHTLFPKAPFSIDNGLQVPKTLKKNIHSKRVVIHPTSSNPAKNWPKKRFFKLRDRLQEKGWEPVFITAPQEACEWESPVFRTLSELASFLYESSFFIGNDSGPGHLASNLGLPSLTIGPSHSHLTLWRPGWAPNQIGHPPKWVEKTKLTRNKWNYFISTSHILNEFEKLTEIK